MSLFNQLVSRQISLCSHFTGSLWPVFESLQCHYSDEVVIYGGMTVAPVPVFACKFTPDGLHGNLLATGDEEGSVRLMDTRRSASQSLIKEIEAHRNAVFDMAWFPRGTKLLTGSGDATVRLWDVVGGVMLTEFKGHSGSVKSVDVKTDEPSMFVSGSRDGSIHVWDTRCAKRGSTHRPVNTVSSAHKRAEVVASTTKRKQRGRKSVGLPNRTGDSKHGVTSVLFHGNHSIASCGTDGLVKLWDLRRTYTNSRLAPPPSWFTFEPLTEAGRQYSFTSLVSGPYQNNLFASCTDDMCYMYNSSGLNKLPVRVFSGHLNSSFYVKSSVSPDGRYLLSGSSCGNAFLWQIDHPEVPPLMLTGHTKEVTAVAWCPTDPSKIATCSDDNDLRLWRVARGQRSPGEVTGTCQSYTEKGHLTGMENLRKRLEDLSTRTEQSRTALKSIQPQSTIKSTSMTAGPAIAKISESVVSTPGNDRPDHHHNCLNVADDISSSVSKLRTETSSQLTNGMSICSDNVISNSTETFSNVAASSEIYNPPSLGLYRAQNSSKKLQQGSEITHISSEKDTMLIGQTDVVGTSCSSKRTRTVHSTKLCHVVEENGVPMGGKGSSIQIVEETLDGKGSSPQHVAVTPERCVSGYNSSTKRKLDLRDENKPKAKRRRTMERDSSSSRKKLPKVKTELASCESEKDMGQRTMQFYFRPA